MRGVAEPAVTLSNYCFVFAFCLSRLRTLLMEFCLVLMNSFFVCLNFKHFVLINLLIVM